MREAELANLLLAIAADQGVPMSTAAEEIAALTLPSWVDAALIRSALVDAVERRMRAQLESELDTLRQRMLRAAPDVRPLTGAQPVAMMPSPAAAHDTPPPAAMPSVASAPSPAATQIPGSAGTQDPRPVLVREADLPPNSLPPDSTMVWTTQHGRPPEEG